MLIYIANVWDISSFLTINEATFTKLQVRIHTDR